MYRYSDDAEYRLKLSSLTFVQVVRIFEFSLHFSFHTSRRRGGEEKVLRRGKRVREFNLEVSKKNRSVRDERGFDGEREDVVVEWIGVVRTRFGGVLETSVSVFCASFFLQDEEEDKEEQRRRRRRRDGSVESE